MATTWTNLLTFLRDHGDVLSAALSLIILAQACVIFLWARAATQLRGRAERNLATAEAAQLEVARLAAEVARLEDAARLSGTRAPDYRVRGDDDAPAGLRPAPRFEIDPPAPAEEPATGDVPRELVFPEDEVVHDPQAVRAASWATAPDSPATPGANGASLSWAALLGGQPDASPAGDAGAPDPVDGAAASAAPPGTGTSVPAGWSSTAPAGPATPPPAPATPAGPDRPPGDAAAAAGDPPGDVLLVEDDDNVARLYRSLLETRGYTLRHAEDGQAGLEEAQRQRPALILLDMMMPRMNGISFLQAMRDDPRLADVPVVVLSNFREERLVERAAALGALEYLVKAQTRPDALVNAIPQWMRGDRALR